MNSQKSLGSVAQAGSDLLKVVQTFSKWPRLEKGGYNFFLKVERTHLLNDQTCLHTPQYENVVSITPLVILEQNKVFRVTSLHAVA